MSEWQPESDEGCKDDERKREKKKHVVPYDDDDDGRETSLHE